MAPRTLRTFAAVMTGLLLGVLMLSTRPADARYAADFAPTRTPAEAARIVAEAQAREAILRASVLPLRGVEASQLPSVPVVYFPQTGHHLSNRAGFLNFWRQNGQVKIFGYPITEEIVEDGRIVQYFERARFEYHPGTGGEPGSVGLGLVGREAAALSFGEFARPEAPPSGGLAFAETPFGLSGEFQAFWEKRGGLPIFGYPISAELDAEGRIVQYFERARMEYFPEDMPAFFRSMEAANGFAMSTLHEVRLSDVGRQVAIARGHSLLPVLRMPGAAEWSPALWQRRIDVNLSTQWLTAYEGDLVVFRAPVATGKDGFNTPVGEYAIYDRLPMQTMIGSAGGESWYVPNIPWVQYVVGGVAFHGTYWHNAHGTGARMSHGCINLRLDDAQWLYEWADIGTKVRIFF